MMVVFAWILLVLAGAYVSYAFIASNVVALGSGGRTIGFIPNAFAIALLCVIFYFVYTEFPFVVNLK